MSRSRSAGSVQVVRYDGVHPELLSCKPLADGTLQSEDGRYQFDGALCDWLGGDLAILRASQVQLLTETDFHLSRRRIVFRSLFENKGDLMQLAQWGAIIACFVVALFLWAQMGDVAGKVSHMVTIIDRAKLP